MILLLLPTYILTFIMEGYYLRVIKISINDDTELPIFNKWYSMFVDGIKLFLLSLLYLVIPTILVIIELFLTIDLANAKLAFVHLSPIPILVLVISVLLYIVALVFYEIGG